MTPTEDPFVVPSESPTPTIPGGQIENPFNAAAGESIASVSERVAAAHVADAQAGPKKRGRPRKIPVDDLGGSTVQILRGKAAGASDPVAAAPAEPVDMSIWKELIGGIVGVMSEFGANMVARAAYKRTGDHSFANEARQLGLMTPKTAALMETGYLGVAKKYAGKFEFVEETAAIAGTGLWIIGVANAVRTINADPRVMQSPKVNAA